MPHERQRHLHLLVLKALRFSPIVGIVGQRQVGKTTLAESIVKDQYVTLDDHEQLQAAQLQPKAFLVRDKLPFAIDECQLAPGLFPAIKLLVQKNKRPGQLLLTGSVRFTGRKSIRESLTGRIYTLELLPLTLAELFEVPLGDIFSICHKPLREIEKYYNKRKNFFGKKGTQDYLKNGGLPGICFYRDTVIQKAKWRAHVDTLLRRDLRLVLETTLSVSSIQNMLSVLAESQGNPTTLVDLARRTRLSTNTIKKVLLAFENLFLIRVVEPIGDRKHPVIFLEDQGQASFLSTRSNPLQDKVRLLFSQVFAQMTYQYPNEGRLNTYQTRGGAHVPLVLSVENKMLGLIPVLGEVADLSAIKSSKSFLKRYPKAKILILTEGETVTSPLPNVISAPYKIAL